MPTARLTLLQAQIRAIAIGVLWPIPYLIIFRFIPGPAALAWLLFFPILTAFLTAILIGPFDLLVVVSCLIPTAFNLVFSEHTMLVHFYRGFHGTFIGPDPYLPGLILLAAAGIGIALKRWLLPAANELLDGNDAHVLKRWLMVDITVVVMIPLVLLAIDAHSLAHQYDPTILAKTRARTLASPSASEQEKIQVIMELQRDRSPAAKDLLRQAFKSPSPKIKFAAAICLLERGDIIGLPLLEDRMMHSAKAEVTSGPMEIHPDWLGYGQGAMTGNFNLGLSLSNIKDPAAMPILMRLMTSPDVDVRRGAASALRNIAAPASAPALIKGLEDPDEMVRYFSTCAIIEIGGDGHYPAVKLYQQNEQIYLDRGKAWARKGTNPSVDVQSLNQ